MEKACFKCMETLPISEFYVHPRMGDGHLGKCKSCTRKDSEIRRRQKERDPKWVEQERLRHRKKANRVRVEKPEVHKARSAIRTMKIDGYHLHHWSYQVPHRIDVFKLTPQEHRRAHRFLVYDAEHLQYRRTDTMELLDTRERHEAYLNDYVSTKPF